MCLLHDNVFISQSLINSRAYWSFRLSSYDESSLKWGNDTSLEVHLSDTVHIWENPNAVNGQQPAPIDPLSYDWEEYKRTNLRPAEKDDRGRVLINKGKLYLWETLENITMHKSSFARIETKSKIARLGISAHNTAPAIQRDFKDKITLEITNSSDVPVLLTPYRNHDEPGTVVAQLFFEDIQEENLLYKIQDKIDNTVKKFTPVKIICLMASLIIMAWGYTNLARSDTKAPGEQAEISQPSKNNSKKETQQ